MRLAAVILAITALSFFVFPGHTYLQQDSLIYVPILDCQFQGCWPGQPEDLVTARPHVNYTLFDELTNTLRRISHAPLEYVLQGEQLFFRALGFLGIYLIAKSLFLDANSALIVTAICAIGANVKGPEVLTIEYEPTPRAFAVPLLMLAAGMALHRRYWTAGIVGAAAFLLHAPAAWPFWLALLVFAFAQPRAAVAFAPLTVALVVLLWAGSTQRVEEPQPFFGVIPPPQETLQRMRAAYNYVSTWWTQWMGWYVICAAVAFLAMKRVHARREHWILLGGLILIGLLSVPLSWFLLDYERLALIPQIQPARALLFTVAFAALTAAAAGCSALAKRNWKEAAVWFFCSLAFPIQTASLDAPVWRAAATVACCCLLLVAWPASTRWVAALLLAPAMAIPAGLVTSHRVDTPDLAALADWSRGYESGMYVFPEAGRDRSPGWFRARSTRPVYVDWKEGGQVNYFRGFAYEWRRRWQTVMSAPVNPAAYRDLGIRYLVLTRPLNGLPLLYHNRTWYVYGLQPPGLL